MNSNAVILNVYDLNNINNCLWCIGMGGYHSTIQIYNEEYSFGPVHGIFANYVKKNHTLPLRESKVLGTTNKSHSEIRDILNDMKIDFNINSYDMLKNSCNHFSDELSMILVDSAIPNYVNRLALIFSCVPCLIPRKIDNSEDTYLLRMAPYVKRNMTDDNLLDYEIIDFN